MSQILVVDGNIAHNRLAEIGLDEKWLYGELKKLGVNDISEVLVAQLNTLGNYMLTRKQIGRDGSNGGEKNTINSWHSFIILFDNNFWL